MNELLMKRFAYSLVRHLLTLGAGYVVAQGIWTEADAATYVSGLALAIVGLGWSFYEKHGR